MEFKEIKISECRPFEDYPFKVKDDQEMQMLVESIRENGVMVPVMVRPVDDGFEVISGHRRIYACIEAGIKTVPAFIRPMDRDAAVICMVDSNLHRGRLLPSEKAFAYKMKVEALAHQGKTSVQPGQKSSRGQVAEEAGESETQIQRYIRLTYLEKPLLDLVDEGRIALTPAVELSYLKPEEQKAVLITFETDEVTPSYSQAVRMRKMSQEGMLTLDKIFEIMVEVKGNQKEFIKVPLEPYEQYLGKYFTPRERREFILEALEFYTKYLEQQRSGRSR